MKRTKLIVNERPAIVNVIAKNPRRTYLLRMKNIAMGRPMMTMRKTV